MTLNLWKLMSTSRYPYCMLYLNSLNIEYIGLLAIPAKLLIHFFIDVVLRHQSTTIL